MHLLLPTDGKALAGLASCVMEIAFAEVGLAEVGKVDEGDATQIEAQEEGVSCKFLIMCEILRESQMSDLADGGCGDGPLSGLGYACVDVPEGVLLWGQALLHGFVVGGAKRAEVEGAGVAANL